MKTSYRRLWTVLWVLGLVATTAMGFQAAPEETPDEQEDEVAAIPATLEIVEQSPSVAAGESLVFRVRSTGLDLTELIVDIAVYPKVEPPEPELTPGDRRPLLSSDDAASAEVIVSSAGLLTIRIPIGTEAADGELPLPGPGVYPLRLSLTDTNGAVATADTTLISRSSPGDPDSDSDATTGNADDADDEPDTAPAGPRPVGLVLDVGAGALSIPLVTELLAADAELPATVVVHRDAVTELERNDDARRAFVEALGTREAVVGTSIPLDPSALVVAGQADAYRLAHQQMLERMDSLRIPVDTQAVILDAPLTAGGVDLLAELGVSTAVAYRLVNPGSTVPWPAATGLVAGGGSPMFVLGPDFGRLVLAADGGDTATAQAHGLLARLALAEQPTALVGGLARLDDPALVIALLDDPDLAAMWTLLPITDPLFQGATGAPAVALWAAPGQSLAPSGPTLARIEELLARYQGFHADGPRSPGHYRNVLMEAFRVDVAPVTRTDTLGRVEAELTAAFDQITLPGNQSVTLAAQAAPLPVAVENSAEGARFVRVQVTSDKITMADPGLILRIDPGASAVDVPVRTRSLGSSPLTVTLLTPDGGQVLSTTKFQVRSTAVPGLGLLISALGLGALLVWWYVSLRRSRREAGGNGGNSGNGGPGEDPGPTPDHGPVETGSESGQIDLRPADDPIPVDSARTQVHAGDSV